MADISSIESLALRSSFIFAGTIATLGQSSLDVLKAQPGLAVVRFDRGFRVNPVLGKLDGRPITVRLAQGGAGTGAVRPGQQIIFFTTAWVHGRQIAVTELSRLPADDKTKQEVARAVAGLSDLHLSQRVATSVLIVQGTVTGIARATDIPRTASEHDPDWMRALIEVNQVLKGQASRPPGRGKRAGAAVLFPGSRDIAFRSTPRPLKGQKAVFLLHEGGPQLPKEAFVAPDAADIQPPSALSTVRRLLGGSATQPPD